MASTAQARTGTFFTSVFFVLGFALIFSFVGVLLQTVLAHVTALAQAWLGYIGGLIIIAFGLFAMGLWTPDFLVREHVVRVGFVLRSSYLTSFVFGAAFAVGWTPCVSAALGAILALAATTPGSAFFLLFAYTIGLGAPFLLVGLFADQARKFIKQAGAWLVWTQRFFGALLVLVGVFVFVGQLSRFANSELIAALLDRLGLVSGLGGNIAGLNFANLGIAFLAGLGSFLSPCILPLVPGLLSYLATITTATSSHDI
ncbi:MAG TPA: cytochrome c biogenesis protein CcdA [Candidatus Paceibacterota bacterium]|nr:cytochrome c biogenesis protein CcdA [Candidatus Paceibacterota bacterium]